MDRNKLTGRTVRRPADMAVRLVLMLALVLSLGRCSKSSSDAGDEPDPIYVISREEGSGTRSAFVELTGIKTDGVDHTTLLAEVSQSTAVVMGTVAGNEHAISYVSMGVLNDTVKAVKVDSVEPTAANIAAGTYSLSRPFLVCTGPQVSALAEDFMEFILSGEGQAVITAEGYIPPSDRAEPYTMKKGLSGRIVLSGSTSVAPVVQVLADRYRQIHEDVEIEIQQTGSSAGITGVLEGACDLGLSSRSLTEDEVTWGLKETVLALDGIAVIVSPDNPVGSMTSEQIRGIFTGEITDWRQL